MAAASYEHARELILTFIERTDHQPTGFVADNPSQANKPGMHKRLTYTASILVPVI